MGFYDLLRRTADCTVGRLIGNTIFPDTRISINSCGDIQIDSCRKILMCSDVCIRIRSVDMIIELWGADLKMTCADPDSISVSGKITSVNFVPQKKLRRFE